MPPWQGMLDRDRPLPSDHEPGRDGRDAGSGDALAEAASASRHVGAAINLQSVVLLTKTSDGTFLFGGDMQFADPGVSADGLQEEVDALRAEIASHAPFDFLAKLSHHGSSNAFDLSVLQQWAGTKHFGICAGENSVADPTLKPSWICSPARARSFHLGAHRPQRPVDVHVRCPRSGPPSPSRGVRRTTPTRTRPRDHTSDLDTISAC